MLFNKHLERNFKVCLKCGHHFRLSARERLAFLLDEGSFTELGADLTSVDPLGFVDSKPYPERVLAAQAKTGLPEAAIYGLGMIKKQEVVVAAIDFDFMGGSMGSVVGEKITRAIEKAARRRLPLIIVSASGGARMQEGMISLAQMAKTAAALGKLDEAGVPFISILTDPTTAGVLASFASLGDINIAEPEALIGFTGMRVAEQTIRERLPKDFQRSEFLLEHGFIDMIVPRPELRETVGRLLEFYARKSVRSTVATGLRGGLESGTKAIGSKLQDLVGE